MCVLHLTLSPGCHSIRSAGSQTGGFYKCNRYNPKRSKKKGKAAAAAAAPGDNSEQKEGEKGEEEDEEEPVTEADEAKAELDRYLHYYQRYHNHANSEKFAKHLMANTESRMQRLQAGTSSLVVAVLFVVLLWGGEVVLRIVLTHRLCTPLFSCHVLIQPLLPRVVPPTRALPTGCTCSS